jgi:hypothetical protein
MYSLTATTDPEIGAVTGEPAGAPTIMELAVAAWAVQDVGTSGSDEKIPEEPEQSVCIGALSDGGDCHGSFVAHGLIGDDRGVGVDGQDQAAVAQPGERG